MSIFLFLLPLFNLFHLFFLKDSQFKNLIHSSLGYTLLNFFNSLILLHLYDSNLLHFQFSLHFFGKFLGGLDGISLWLIFLVNIIIPIVILLAWKDHNFYLLRTYLIFILFVQFFSNLVFFVTDFLLFFISFEGLLIPMYFLIGFYGSKNLKILKAQNTFMLYTLFGSLFFFLALLTLYLEFGSLDYEILLSLPLNESFQNFLFALCLLAFLIKAPTWPFHIWLPLAHGHSSTGVSIILAAILLKLTTFGIIRYLIPFFPLAIPNFLPLILTLALLSIFYSCIASLSILDLKEIIAMSSIAHMNVSLIGLFSNDFFGISGGYLYGLSHGFISGGLFLLVGLLYSRHHTKIIKYYRGLVLIYPLYIFFFFFFTLSNLSFPGSLGFISELFLFFSSLIFSPFLSFLITLVSFLLPLYFILFFQKISFGRFSPYLPLLFQDLNLKEFHLLFPLIFLNTLFGIFPHLILNDISLTILSL